jgi:hypothetical protein
LSASLRLPRFAHLQSHLLRHHRHGDRRLPCEASSVTSFSCPTNEKRPMCCEKDMQHRARAGAHAGRIAHRDVPEEPSGHCGFWFSTAVDRYGIITSSRGDQSACAPSVNRRLAQRTSAWVLHCCCGRATVTILAPQCTDGRRDGPAEVKLRRTQSESRIGFPGSPRSKIGGNGGRFPRAMSVEPEGPTERLTQRKRDLGSIPVVPDLDLRHIYSYPPPTGTAQQFLIPVVPTVGFVPRVRLY